MDPLSVTATLITLTTFIKDLIEVGESIRRSIEKVNENRREIRELTDEVVQTLYDLAKLTKGHEDIFRGPELLGALENLKAEMLYVHSKCLKISVVQLPGFRGVRSQFKAWRKRDDLREKIGRLKEHVSKCYSQFTAFSAARTERNILRIEQTLVTILENQVKARRLEGLMAQVLRETPFGQSVANRTMEIISSDPTHSSLESQYISAQAMSLIASLERLLTSGELVLDGPLFCPAQASRCIFDPCTPLHLLQEILGVVIAINERHFIWKQLESTKQTFINLGTSLVNLGLVSEGIAWERLRLRILRNLDPDYSAAASSGMAHALMILSIAYQRQRHFQSAVQASQQSLDLWHCLPEGNFNGTCLTLTSTTHALNLLETGQNMIALSIAQDAVTLSRPMLEQIIEFGSGSSSCAVDWSCGAMFELAKILSSFDRHLDSYEAWKEGFQTIVRLRVGFHPPNEKHISSFLNDICKLAERGMFSLAMLVDCVVLFRNLSRIYPEQLSSQFLWLLHAYAYFAQQDNPLSMKNIRLFLEPNFDRSPPELDVTRPMDIDLSGKVCIQIKDVIWAFYAFPSHASDDLIRNILITHFDEAISALRDVVSQYNGPSIIFSVLYALPKLSASNQVTLLKVLARTIEHFGVILADRGSEWQLALDILADPSFRHLWRIGLLGDALKVCEEVIKYLEFCFQSDDVTVAAGQWRLNRHFILCDMGGYSEAIVMIQQSTIVPVSAAFLLLPYIVQTRILRCVGRNQESLQLLRRGVAAGRRKHWTNSVQPFHLHLGFLLAESAAAWGYIGNRERALKHAERAVAACRKDMGPDEDVEGQKCVLIHSLVTLSDCLATLGKKNEALAAAQEAALIYTKNAPYMWGTFVYTIRKQELGANAFHALSLRLVTSDMVEQALLNAEKATELYRELAALAPRHLATLASSLRNLGSILRAVGRRDAGVAACEAAAGIMRMVVKPETYFLPALAEALEQLAVYLAEKGDIGAASAAAAECAQVRREFAALPPEPEFLFGKVADMVDSEDEAEGWAEADEYHDASEGPSVGAVESDDEADEYHDTSEPPTNVEPPALISEPSGRSSTSAPGPSTDTDAPIQANPAGDSATVILDSSSTPTIQNPAAMDTVKSMFSKPLEVDMRLRLRSTLMDVLWWVFLGISFAIAWRRVV